VTLASVREVEAPRFATETKAIAFSSHQLILSTWASIAAIMKSASAFVRKRG